MKELEKEFRGVRSVKGFIFTQIKCNKYAYIYKVSDVEYGNEWYEVFERKIAKERDTVLDGVAVHFDAKVVYPNDDSFGKTAWTSMTISHAEHLFRKISLICKNRELEQI